MANSKTISTATSSNASNTAVLTTSSSTNGGVTWTTTSPSIGTGTIGNWTTIGPGVTTGYVSVGFFQIEDSFINIVKDISEEDVIKMIDVINEKDRNTYFRVLLNLISEMKNNNFQNDKVEKLFI